MSDVSKSQNPFSRRPVKPNPLLRSRGAISDQRRELFHKKNQENRDNHRWAARGDQILRLDYISERRKWEAQLAETAPPVEEPPEEEEADLPTCSGQPPIFESQTALDSSHLSSEDAREVDEFRRQEEEDLEALIALMETRKEEEQQHPAKAQPSERYGSDDDDYDGMFLSLITDGPKQTKYNTVEAEAMDTGND
ncbi:MAG: hypothetical protein M1821_007811 [Bathelium mastoideum]|nr:MAG: hypothetical protein M1821_007811 [Bathelium mastoideum]KAI9688591.1 MAG: hypothetical protein M1822_001540 [Bathelium mastoideum]